MYYENFEKLCLEKNVTASKVSKATGISTATLSSWKKDVYTPKQDKLQLIADYFGVTLDYLINGESQEIPLPGQMDLWNAAREDKNLLKIMKEYLEMNDKDKKHIIDAVNYVCEAKNKNNK